MRIAVDKNQVQAGSHYKSNFRNHRALEKMGHELVELPLPYSDYCRVTDEMQDTIDRRGMRLKKADLVGDIKVAVDRNRKALNELIYAIKSVALCEVEGIHERNDRLKRTLVLQIVSVLDERYMTENIGS